MISRSLDEEIPSPLKVSAALSKLWWTMKRACGEFVPPACSSAAPHGFDSQVHSSKLWDEQVWVLQLCSLNTVLAIQCLFHRKFKVRFSTSGAGRHSDGLRWSRRSLRAALPSEQSCSSSRRAPGISGYSDRSLPVGQNTTDYSVLTVYPGTSSSFFGWIHQGFLF